ncbi:HIRAN domain-containing protein [Pedococcus bigeumensis]|uniref:HIRAN domain-containing protein n=1 Tax=Pedococcus bigeumensis TaxID=433644 RepID=A0A502CMI0_9MICO|nr:HIRAN domain-containing protein [Pedococcus bigeumensis]TPG12901.1 hypothetical protein EAH86_19360 [Pedococcus bigeumensis]
MGWGDLFGGRASEPVANAQDTVVATATRSVPLTGQDRWYVPVDGNRDRFVDPDGGMPLLHLIRYHSGGEHVLRLCEDATGLLMGPTDRRLAPAGIYVSNLRGESYHKTACRRGNFSPGTAVQLKREPNNSHDPFAVAITADADGAAVAAYVNKAKARTLAKLLDHGTDLAAVSLRGTSSNTACEQVSVLVTRADVMAHLLSPRPRHLPKPAHQR